MIAPRIPTLTDAVAPRTDTGREIALVDCCTRSRTCWACRCDRADPSMVRVRHLDGLPERWYCLTHAYALHYLEPAATPYPDRRPYASELDDAVVTLLGHHDSVGRYGAVIALLERERTEAFQNELALREV